jgi:GNAT superfamily N-acetyltransferase
MLYQLAPENVHLVQPLFAGGHHLAVQSVLAGESPAEVFVDDPQAPQAALLMLWNQRLYLAGNPARTAFAASFATLLHERYMPQASEERPRERAIAFTPAAWEHPLAALFADIEAFRVERQYYRLDLKESVPAPVLPEGFVLRSVDAGLVAESSLLAHADLMEEMLSEAPSVEAFLQQRFGFCLQYGQELVGWCLSEYNHAQHCELGITTASAYQRRGLALASAWATMAYAQTQGITTIGWHCWKRNIPSSNLAKKLGFELVQEAPVWYCRFGKRPA